MPLFNLTGDALSWATIASASLGMILYGYDQGVMSGLITADNFKMEIFKTVTPKASLSGLVVAIYEIGAFVGSIAVMIYGQYFGRRITLAIGQTFIIIGALIQCTSFGFAQMIIGRIITGFGMGHVTSTCTVWGAEISRASYRGRCGVCLLLCAVFGVIVAYWVDYACSFYDTQLSFRFPLAFQVVFSVIQMITMLFLPESPRWLFYKGREDEGKDVIRRIAGTDSMDASPEAEALIIEIKEAIATEADGKSVWREVFTWSEFQYPRRLLLAFGTQAMQQLTGINIIVYYSVVVFKQSVGMGDHLALLMGGFLSITFFVGTLVSTILIDRVGRRPLMMAGLAGSCIGMIITATGVSFGTYTAGLAATFGIFWFQFVYGVGVQSAPWIYAVEITPLKLRHIGGAVSSASGWIWTYCVVQVTQPGIESLGYKYFIVWAVLCFVWFWVVFFCYPETKGKTLEELDYIFVKNGGIGHYSAAVESDNNGTISKSIRAEYIGAL
ncbi:putative MFS sugar transporter [Melanomma pulvis-pyrius CBS 109.77]|uniref:Putative MFS sugar transporter n=1 Tax=Melanomma pulvis-pyrius CBS 109.77 TaxID=1314802 RepID=A0A6A6WWL4_9PLEO|nr:putative MFS sugar transporter [Melanomma pulvis-pyrius CBS 109.77]